jgi:Tol biopolymer transport system component
MVSLSTQGVLANDRSVAPSISDDGRFIAFTTYATNLVANDSNGSGYWGRDVFVHDRLTGTTTMVCVDSNGVQGNSYSAGAAISGDGRYVSFTSDADNLVPGDTNNCSDVFVHDLSTGQTERVSLNSNGVEGNNSSRSTSLSEDGRFVAFQSSATNLHPGSRAGQIFVRDRLTGQTEIVSINARGVDSVWGAVGPSISADGRFVAFSSMAANLYPGISNGWSDIFVHDRQWGVTTRVSHYSSGEQSNGHCRSPSISGDGQIVAFESSAKNLGATNGKKDYGIYFHNRWDNNGQDSIHLNVDPIGHVGQPLHLKWSFAPPRSRFVLSASLRKTGMIRGGHQFDLGYPITVLANGKNSRTGNNQFFTAPLASNLAGLRIYFEIGAVDEHGVYFDSNAPFTQVQ